MEVWESCGIAFPYDIATLWWSRHQLFNTLNDTTITDSVLIAFRDSLEQAEKGLLDSLSRLMCDNSTDSATLQAHYAVNSTTTPVDSREQHHKNVNEICMQHNLAKVDTFSQAQVQQLQNIAQLCPYTDGPAVYMARVLLAPIDSTEYANNCERIVLSGGSSKRSSGSDGESNSNQSSSITDQPLKRGFKLYPNPNNGKMQVDYKLGEGESGQLIIMDVSGKQLREYQLPGDKQNLHIGESELKAGIYFYQVNINRKTIKTGKLIIIN